jgi:hypothetical protein
MLGLGRLTKTVSDATIGTAIVIAHVALAERLEQKRRSRVRSIDPRRSPETEPSELAE